MTAAVVVTPGGDAECDGGDGDGDGGDGGPVVRVHLAAEVVVWDYVAPPGRPGAGTDRCSGAPFGEAERIFTDATALSPGGRYLKSVYREYAGADLATRVVHPLTGAAGLAGPTVHVEVGETLQVTLTNRLPWAANWDVAALTPLSAVVTATTAAAAVDRTGLRLGRGDGVIPGETVTYRWAVPPEAAPSSADLSTVGHAYVSSVDAIGHGAAGLYGVVAVGHRGALPPPPGPGGAPACPSARPTRSPSPSTSNAKTSPPCSPATLPPMPSMAVRRRRRLQTAPSTTMRSGRSAKPSTPSAGTSTATGRPWS
eukprot:TRINITY_DN5912_c0_g1_i1.p1 TRINITY_DN5912_c0_g1~~TRINITY_DN5912_c0_g1_i1.p1  ORF type:complete len:312 (-),score=94.04 TRINITY_DN5912_c0_g1_i1:271-1206(-)